MTLPPLPDLATLTDEEKDDLIVGLWSTIAALEGAADDPTRSGPPTGLKELRARIGTAAPSRRARWPASAARQSKAWAGILESGLVLGILIVIGAGFIVDFGIGWYQKHDLAMQRRAALELQQAAFAGLDVELVDASYAPDGKSYRVRLAMRNLDPAVPLYIMLNPGRVYVQTGLTWQGVPTQAAAGVRWGVVKLVDTLKIGMVFQVGLVNWTQLLPGYMHLRIQSDMLVSRSSEPKDDLVERVNRFNLYLKPREADDTEIKRRLSFPGAPPVYIPMPPH